MFLAPEYGVVGYVSYLYYLVYELLSPFIELFGLLTIILAYAVNLINVPFMILFFLNLCLIWGSTDHYGFFCQDLYTEYQAFSPGRTEINLSVSCGKRIFPVYPGVYKNDGFYRL